MRLNQDITGIIIHKLLNSEDYRTDIVAIINVEFLQFAIDFFKEIVSAKFRNQAIDVDWYKEHFLNPNRPSDDLIIHAGLNRKTIGNIYQSTSRSIVLDVTENYYESLLEYIHLLSDRNSDIEIQLTIKFQGVSVDLNLTESLIIINTLAVKRAQLRGGAWSTLGKQVELPLMLTLAKLSQVPPDYYALKGLTTEGREVDFYFFDSDQKPLLCEVKLMGKGNPESADAVIARDSAIFIADTLSERNKEQLTSRGIYWVELRNHKGYMKLSSILETLNVPHRSIEEFSRLDLEIVLKEVFEELP